MKVFVDVVLMAIKNNKLSAFCIKRNRKDEPFFNEWALPGGYIPDHSPTLEHAVEATLRREIGVQVNFEMEQLYTFGPSGDPRGPRLSVSYIAFIDHKQIDAIKTADSKESQWIPVNKMPNLAFDHNEIVKMAEKRIQNKIQFSPVGFYFIGEEFTMNEVVDTFSTILGKTIDQSNLRKKLLTLGVITETNKKEMNKKGRPSPIFKLHKKVLNSLPNTTCFFGKNS